MFQINPIFGLYNILRNHCTHWPEYSVDYNHLIHLMHVAIINQDVLALSIRMP